MTKLIYLAQPYSHPDEAVRKARCDAGAFVAARIMQRFGEGVIAPIPFGDSIAYELPDKLRYDNGFWMHHCINWLRKCDEVWFLPLIGWGTSRGLKEELSVAAAMRIPVSVIRPRHPTEAERRESERLHYKHDDWPDWLMRLMDESTEFSPTFLVEQNWGRVFV